MTTPEAKPRIFVLPLAIIAAALLAASFLFPLTGLPAIELCALRRLTGLPCPLCGITRSICAISHGQFDAAWHYNPFGFPAYALALIFIAGWPVVRRYPGIEAWLIQRGIMRYGAAFALIVFFTFGVCRFAAVLLGYSPRI
jgi:hypothetical protein